jgi:hypothetical protein
MTWGLLIGIRFVTGELRITNQLTDSGGGMEFLMRAQRLTAVGTMSMDARFRILPGVGDWYRYFYVSAM